MIMSDTECKMFADNFKGFLHDMLEPVVNCTCDAGLVSMKVVCNFPKKYENPSQIFMWRAVRDFLGRLSAGIKIDEDVVIGKDKNVHTYDIKIPFGG